MNNVYVRFSTMKNDTQNHSTKNVYVHLSEMSSYTYFKKKFPIIREFHSLKSIPINS